MDEELLEKAELYAKGRGSTIGEALGFGIHGIVVVLKGKADPAATALKIHSRANPYERERAIYERLKESSATNVRGFHVPQLLRWDDRLLALEMTVVAPPFVLDFAGGYLDFAPEFPEEAWVDWRCKNEEQFGQDWPEAQGVLATLEAFGIYMLDPSPSNIRFR